MGEHIFEVSFLLRCSAVLDVFRELLPGLVLTTGLQGVHEECARSFARRDLLSMAG